MAAGVGVGVAVAMVVGVGVGEGVAVVVGLQVGLQVGSGCWCCNSQMCRGCAAVRRHSVLERCRLHGSSV